MSAPTLVQAAERLAVEAHEGQTDKAGLPYIEHPRRVAHRLDTPEAQAAALLHDVLEDTEHTAADLAAAGIPPAVVEAVVVLTKRPCECHRSAVERAARHALARPVKEADIADNLDPARLAMLEEQQVARLRAKYDTALRTLADVAVDPSAGGHPVLVVDDLRIFDDLPAAEYVRTSAAALQRLQWHVDRRIPLAALWLDHDLGPDDDIRPVVRWLEEAYHHGMAPEIGEVVAHTSNPVGAADIERALGRRVPTRRVDAGARRVRVQSPPSGDR